MKIGINGQNLLITNPAGPEKYTLNLISALSQIDNDNDYTIYLTDTPSNGFFASLTSSNLRFKYKVVKTILSWTQISLAMELLHNKMDVFFTSVHTMPVIRNPNTKMVCMVHGLEYKFSDKSIFAGWPEWFVCKFSDALIAPSEHTKKAILAKNWNIPIDKITVVPEGVSADFCKSTPEKINKIKEKYNITTSRYFIFVSTIQPRKNIPNIVEAFSKIKTDMPFKLLICGKLGWDYKNSLDAPKKFNIEDKVVFAGRIPDEDLPVLLSGAVAYINMSFEEGFGLPLLEAMACSTPCLVSDIEAFRELGQSSVLYADPNNVDKIAEMLQYILDENYPSEWINSAKNASLNYTWAATAMKTLEVLKSLAPMPI